MSVVVFAIRGCKCGEGWWMFMALYVMDIIKYIFNALYKTYKMIVDYILNTH
ncbi:MAG: hypothetical protein IRD7MM_06875 [Candidatus Midichloria mitochondrii]|uniref:Uncharacterized protein n=1 Tax=Midichloria mitochondrii (strain IricVA) TaxID=696127 RepID=F7XX02_MIDMI|nr:hypothetical protein midi_00917 [Candidatus Midichloria mitochondrii IricVA]